jgi:DNA mismatch endonuclease (patch repair protein)
MSDRISSEIRSAVMSRIRSKDSKPERMVRSALHMQGFRFRLHRKDLPGKPDIVLPGFRTVIFVHGCFWHQHQHCKDGHRPQSRLEYWGPKLDRNVERDKKNKHDLEKAGWRVIILWECEVEKDLQRLVAEVDAQLRRTGKAHSDETG